MDLFTAASKMCDEYCKYPYICRDQEELNEKCRACPLKNCIKEIVDEFQDTFIKRLAGCIAKGGKHE